VFFSFFRKKQQKTHYHSASLRGGRYFPTFSLAAALGTRPPVSIPRGRGIPPPPGWGKNLTKKAFFFVLTKANPQVNAYIG
jgi:hypothetical protein